MPPTLNITRIQTSAMQVIAWFNINTDLRTVSPQIATESTIWGATRNDDMVGLALVEGNTLHRLGVSPDCRRDGVASKLVSHLLEEHNKLEVECRKPLSANNFYEATGWTRVTEKPAEPENLIVWHKESPHE